ncbi:MAG: hypothetical protein V4702_03205 [Patescibacteria group bacterium]
MNKIIFAPEQRSAELDLAHERKLLKDRLFILLLGPSGVGKSTIIKELNNLTGNTRFSYVKPFMTRPLRPDETDKISISSEGFDQMKDRSEFVVVNDRYHVRYGTPLSGILSPLSQQITPILDYPLETVPALQRPEYDTLNFYVYPASIEEWKQRMESSGRNMNGRLEAGLHELGRLAALGFVHPDIDLSVVNADGASSAAAHDILECIDTLVT